MKLNELKRKVDEVQTNNKASELDKRFALAILNLAEEGVKMRDHKKNCNGCPFCD